MIYAIKLFNEQQKYMHELESIGKRKVMEESGSNYDDMTGAAKALSKLGSLLPDSKYVVVPEERKGQISLFHIDNFGRCSITPFVEGKIAGAIDTNQTIYFHVASPYTGFKLYAGF